MEINTKYFGTLSYTEAEEIVFERGIFGFEDNRKFLLIRFDNDSGNILCLQNIENAELAFTVMNPFSFIPDYKPELNDCDLKKIEATNNKELNFYNICVIASEIGNSTVNLRCPIAINTENRKAIQVILENDQYNFKYPFHQFLKEG